MSKSFVDEVRKAWNNEGDPDEWPCYGSMLEKLIAVDDWIKALEAVTARPENAEDVTSKVMLETIKNIRCILNHKVP